MVVSGLMVEAVVDKKAVEAEVMVVEVEVILSEISLVTVILEVEAVVEVYQVGLDQMDYQSNY